jgi:hypothetical protein
MGIDKRLDDLEKQTGVNVQVYFADDPPTPTPAILEQVKAELARWEEERFGEIISRWLVIDGPGGTVILPDNERG